MVGAKYGVGGGAATSVSAPSSSVRAVCGGAGATAACARGGRCGSSNHPPTTSAVWSTASSSTTSAAAAAQSPASPTTTTPSRTEKNKSANGGLRRNKRGMRLDKGNNDMALVQTVSLRRAAPHSVSARVFTDSSAFAADVNRPCQVIERLYLSLRTVLDSLAPPTREWGGRGRAAMQRPYDAASAHALYALARFLGLDVSAVPTMREGAGKCGAGNRRKGGGGGAGNGGGGGGTSSTTTKRRRGGAGAVSDAEQLVTAAMNASSVGVTAARQGGVYGGVHVLFEEAASRVQKLTATHQQAYLAKRFKAQEERRQRHGGGSARAQRTVKETASDKDGVPDEEEERRGTMEFIRIGCATLAML